MLAAYMPSAVAMETSPQPFAMSLKQMLLKASPKVAKRALPMNFGQCLK